MKIKCPKCGSNNVHLAATVPHALCVCFDCRHQWKNKYKPRKKTVFQKITQSPEALAAAVVYPDWAECMGGDCWTSPFVGRYHTKEEAISATVESLKEVEK